MPMNISKKFKLSDEFQREKGLKVKQDLSMLQGMRVDSLPPYILGEVANQVASLRRDGKEVIDLSHVNPYPSSDTSPVDKLVQASLQPHNHRYSSSQGITKLREAIVKRYKEKYQVELD